MLVFSVKGGMTFRSCWEFEIGGLLQKRKLEVVCL